MAKAVTPPAEALIGRYLARRDEIAPADRIALMGSAVLESVETAAELYHQSLAPQILISGGIGHSTHHLEEAVRRRGLDVHTTGRPESHVFRDLLITRYGVPPESIVVEDKSTNCGENAHLTRQLVDRPETLLLIQDPTMQRRTHACFERSFSDLPGTTLISHAPLIRGSGRTTSAPARPSPRSGAPGDSRSSSSARSAGCATTPTATAHGAATSSTTSRSHRRCLPRTTISPRSTPASSVSSTPGSRRGLTIAAAERGLVAGWNSSILQRGCTRSTCYGSSLPSR